MGFDRTSNSTDRHGHKFMDIAAARSGHSRAMGMQQGLNGADLPCRSQGKCTKEPELSEQQITDSGAVSLLLH